jgi:hypothetical protein
MQQQQQQQQQQRATSNSKKHPHNDLPRLPASSGFNIKG